MMRSLFASALIGAAVLGFAGTLSAQTGPGGQQMPPKAGNLMTDESALEAVIKALDPNYKVQAIPDGGGKFYTLKISRDGWNYDIRIESYPNALAIEAILSGPIPAPEKVPGTVFMDLIKLQTTKAGGALFALVPLTNNSGHVLMLVRVTHRELTGEQFTQMVNAHLTAVKDTYPTWSQVK